MRPRLARFAPWLLLGFIIACALAGGWTITIPTPFPGEGEFNVAGWELRHLPNKWLYLTGRFLTGGPSREEQDERLARFLQLTTRIDEAGRRLAETNPAQAEPLRREIEQLSEERDDLENDVEATLEGRLTAALEEAGLESSLPLFPRARCVLPPVDVEFDRTPRVLAVSPRAEILLIEQRPLSQETGLEEAERLEREQEAGGTRSALVQRVSGAATYPSVVEPSSDYEDLVFTVAHEWVHHYLFFKPLGFRYLESSELRTLNETVADIVGRELALQVTARYPLPPELASPGSGRDPLLDAPVDQVLHQLRLEVGRLLEAGRVGEAEALMEQRRRDLEAFGVRFRRINQAFFAFRSIYATDPASIDPIGIKLLLLRARSGSLADFARQAGELTGVADLDRLLAAGDQGRR